MGLIIREAPRESWVKQQEAAAIKRAAADTDIYLDLRKL